MWRKRLAISVATALLLPAAFGGVLAGAEALADNPQPRAVQTADRKPPPRPTRTLSMLGRASAVGWISHGRR